MSMMDNLNTEAKNLLVDAINEVIGKHMIANTIGSPINKTDLWADMEIKIKDIIKDLKDNLSNKGVDVNGKVLSELVDLIPDIPEDTEEIRANIIGLLSEAIGEPTAPEDSIDIICEKVNGITETFRENLIKKGITDDLSELKYKELVDLVKSISGGGGVKYAEGECAISKWESDSDEHKLNIAQSVNIPIDVDFTPKLVFVELTLSTSHELRSGTTDHMLVSNLSESKLIYNYTTLTPIEITMWISSFDSTGINLDFKTNWLISYYKYDIVKWYAIGEEDNALEVNKQKLVNALSAKGINCSTDNSWDEIMEIINTPIQIACLGTDNQEIITEAAVSTNELNTVQCIAPICYEGTAIGDLLHGREINFYCYLHCYQNNAILTLYEDEKVVCTINSTASSSTKSSQRITFNKYATYRATLVNSWDNYWAYFNSAGWEYNIVTF